MRGLSPAIAFWIEETFGIETFALRDLDLRDAEDEEIFLEAKSKRRCNHQRQRFSAAFRAIRFTAESYLADLRQHFKRKSQDYLIENASNCN